MPPIHIYTNWDKRSSDFSDQIDPFRKYYFICEGVNTESFYFRRLINLRKELGIHPLIDIRLMEKTGKDKDITYPKQLADFAEIQKESDDFTEQLDRMIIVFDGDVFEEKVQGYHELIVEIENNGNIVGITNPNFELFLLLHIEGVYDKFIKGKDFEFFQKDEKGRYSHAYKLLLEITGMNAKKNKQIGSLAENVKTAIQQEKLINQDIYNIKGRVTSNIGSIIESIIAEKPNL